MILRRMIAHVRKQEWTAIVLDLVIVVLGVVIGIQVSNWNAERADRKRAHGYLERIRDDLDADIAGYRDRLDFWSDVSASGAKGLAYAETGDAGGATQWQLLRAYFWASQVGAFNLTEATYDELRSAGELGLLGDPRLRDRLASYYTNSKNPTLSESPEYRKHVRGLIPLDIQLYLWENCWQSEMTRQSAATELDANNTVVLCNLRDIAQPTDGFRSRRTSRGPVCSPVQWLQRPPLVPRAGLEPALPCGKRILSP